MKKDIYQEITDKIISRLEPVDLKDYEPPFASLAAQGIPFNPVTDRMYQGINFPSLWCDQQENKYSTNFWATFKQWKQRGASVRKGEKGCTIIFYKTLMREVEDGSGEVAVPMLKTYTVFNADQVDGFESPPLPES